MSTLNNNKKEKLLHIIISKIINKKLTNVNISHTTVTDVKLSGDQSRLKVFVTFIKNKERSLKNIQRTTSFIRAELSKVNSIKKVPKIYFKHDISIENGANIDKIIQNIKTNHKDIATGFIVAIKNNIKSYKFKDIDSMIYKQGTLIITKSGNKLEIYKNLKDKQVNEWLSNYSIYKLNN